MPLQNVRLDIDMLRSRLDYMPDTGDLVWKDLSGEKGRAGYSIWAGKVAGKIRVRKCGYRDIGIQIKRKDFAAHRVCWAIMTGEQPPEMIDHINGDSLDNRWCNLRDGTHLNQKNAHMKSSNKSGITGVTWNKASKKWHAHIRSKEKQVHLGLYSDIEDARAARLAAEKEYGYSDRHGKTIREDRV